eukprot:COSAG02_NODE_42774_length_381_cov_0.939716_1_plen_81_part_10
MSAAWRRLCLCATPPPPPAAAVVAEHQPTHPPNDRAHEFLNLAKHFHWDAVEEALRADPSLVNVQPSRRWSALHQAARSNN